MEEPSKDKIVIQAIKDYYNLSRTISNQLIRLYELMYESNLSEEAFELFLNMEELMNEQYEQVYKLMAFAEFSPKVAEELLKLKETRMLKRWHNLPPPEET